MKLAVGDWIELLASEGIGAGFVAQGTRARVVALMGPALGVRTNGAVFVVTTSNVKKLPCPTCSGAGAWCNFCASSECEHANACVDCY